MSSVTKTIGTYVSSTGTWSSTNPTDISTRDNNYVGSPQGTTYNDWIGRNLNPGIPTGATINGIAIMISFKPASRFDTAYVKCRISVNGGTNWSTYATEQTVTGSNYVDKTYGSSTDTWGLTLTYTNCNDNTNFWVDLAAKGSGSSVSERIDYVTVTFYYTVAQNITMVADSKTVKLTHNDATLVRPLAPLIADSKTIKLTHNTANLATGYVLGSISKTMSLTHNDSILGKGWYLAADYKLTKLTHNDTGLKQGYGLIADSKLTKLTHNSANINYQLKMTANSKNVALTHNDAVITRSLVIHADSKSLTLTKNNVNLTQQLIFTADSKSVKLTHNSVNLVNNLKLQAETRHFSLQSNAVNIITNYKLTANKADLKLNHNAITVTSQLKLSLDSANLTLTAYDANFVLPVKNPGNFISILLSWNYE